jgi:molybdate transport system substrate-binding protein
MVKQVTGISSMATRHILRDLTEAYGQRTGIAVAIRAMGGVEAARLVRAGEAVDVVILAAGAMTALEGEGHLAPGSRVGFAGSGIALAVRSDAARPAITDDASVREAILAAGKVGYSTGPSGEHLLALLKRWGIAEAMADRVVQAPPGVPVATLVAGGDVDLGLQQLSELLGMPGIAVIDALPPEVQSITRFEAGLSAKGDSPERAEDARAFIRFLASPEAAPVIRLFGMEPVGP